MDRQERGKKKEGDRKRAAREELYCPFCDRTVRGSGVKAHLRHFCEEYRGHRPQNSVDCIEVQHLGAVERRNPRSLLRRLGDWMAKLIILLVAAILVAITFGYIKKLR